MEIITKGPLFSHVTEISIWFNVLVILVVDFKFFSFQNLKLFHQNNNGLQCDSEMNRE